MGKEGFAIAVIGDGSFGSGVAYEGMNNAGRSGEKIIIVLNDNDMSISRNVGNVANYLAKMRSSRQYFRFKDNAKSFLGSVPVVGKPIRNALAISKKTLRQMMYHSNLFEDFGLRYFGPVDGMTWKASGMCLNGPVNMPAPVWSMCTPPREWGTVLLWKTPVSTRDQPL